MQLRFLDLMIPKECGAVPMDAATRANLIDLMARVLVVVFHEEGGSVNDRSCTVPRSNRSTWLARRSSTFGSPAKDKYDRIRKVNSSSMRGPNGCVLWAGSRARSSIVTWDRARALLRPSGKASIVSSAWWHWERSESSAAGRYRGYPAPTKTGVGCWRCVRSLERLSLTSNRSTI